MGLMKSSGCGYEFFAVWEMFLVIFHGSANCISAYSLEDIARSKALTMASRSYGLLRNTKLIADFMEDESNEDEANPTCMKG
uniref:DUF4220 domain-containing protein n=1 Tax=Quercus lobata TaxID=97700 RepID=A0A7N2R5K7_QUELO